LDSSSPFQDPHAPNISPNLPVPTLSNLQDIERQIRGVIRAGPIRERVAENDLIRKLIALMSDAEDLQSIEDLQAICTLMQAILLLNNQAIYEYILRDDIFIDMVGLMECKLGVLNYVKPPNPCIDDPEFPRLKAHYREFLRENTKHHQVVEIRDTSIRMKVHQTYRLQYLKDVVLARVLDDPIFNVLNSLIIFNQIDIVNYIQNEEYFLKEVFSIFLRPSEGADSQRLRIEGTPADGDQQVEEQATQDVSVTEGNEMVGQNLTSGSLEDRRPAALLLLHQFCSMGKSVQLPMRLNLFRALVDRGILYPVQWALGQGDIKVLNTAGEILAMVLDHDAGGVRGHILRQVEDHTKQDTTMNGTTGTSVAGEQADSTPHTLLAMMSSLLTSSRHEMSLKSQLAESFRTLMDVPGIDNAMLQPPNLRKEDQQSDRFLDYFYKVCAADLYKPILENVPEHKHMTSTTLELTRAQSDLYLYLCDLLCGFMLQHSYQSHFFVLGKNVAARIASLLYAREKHLRLAALRFFRTCLRLNNRNVYAHMIKHDVFLPILELTRRESIRDNLLSSCCQEFFEHIRRENIKDVIDHAMKVHGSRVRQLADSHVVGQRFLGLINRWDANNEPPPKPEPKPTAIAPKRWGAARAVDAEEDYFNAEEEETPATEPTVGRQTRGQMRRRGAIAGPSTGTGPTGPNNAPPSGRRQRPTSVALPKAYPIGSSTSLVDYPEEDETEALPPSEAGSDPVQPTGKQETKGPVQDGTRLRGRNRRPELTRNASVPNLDPNGVGSQATPKEQTGRRTQSPALTPTSPSPSASSSTSSEMNTTQPGIGVGITGIGLGVGAGMAMDEDEDLIGPPVPLSLSHKRRRETEEEDETMERLAKRPFLGEQPAPTAGANASKAAMQEDSAGAAAPTVAAPTSTPTETPKPIGKRQLRVKLGANVQNQPPDVKVGDKG
ncbi:9859_t:CDS:2, partial [Acaulospora colombiana]